jgi:DNA-binding NarL/FixJ family response regulator
MTMIRLLLVDDEACIRRGLRMRLALEPDVQVVGEASEGAEAVFLAQQLHPDVVVMDVEMQEIDGITAAAAIANLTPPSAVVTLTIHDDAATRERARAAGAVAFVGKHEGCDAVLAAIRYAADPSKHSQPFVAPRGATGRTHCTVRPD